MPVDESIEKSEDFIRAVIEDIQEIVEVAQLKDAKDVYIFTADDWKYKALQMAAGKNMGQAMKDVMADPEMRKAGKEVSKYVGKVISDRLLPNGVDEKAVLGEAQDFLGQEVGMHVILNPAEDPENKRRHAIPGRPALLIK
jgi:leucyl-tRNA synthetase